MEKSKKIRKEFDELVERNGIKKALILIEQPIEGHNFRVIALSDHPDMGDCEFACLIESCANNSEGFAEILDHLSMHEFGKLIGKLFEPKKIKAD